MRKYQPLRPEGWSTLIYFGAGETNHLKTRLQCMGFVCSLPKFISIEKRKKTLISIASSLLHTFSSNVYKYMCIIITGHFGQSVYLGIEFYLFVSHGGMKRQRVHV